MSMENIVLDLKPIGNTVRIGKLNKKGNLLLQTKNAHEQFLMISAIYFSKAKKSKIRAEGKDYMVYACEDSLEKLEDIKKLIDLRIAEIKYD